MIRTKSFEASIPLAMIAAAANKVISPVTGTPLAELVRTSWLMANHANPGTDLGPHRLPESAQYISELSGNEEHNALFDQSIDVLIKSVQRHVSFAKNVVAPKAISMAEHAIDDLSKVHTADEQFTVTVWDLPKPMQNDAVRDGIGREKGQSFVPPESDLHVGSRSPQEIIALMLTGATEYDEKIKEWAAGVGDVFLVSLWDNLFCDFRKSNPSIVKKFEEFVGDAQTGVDASLAIYLLSRRLFDAVPEGIDTDPETFRKIASQYRETSALRLWNTYESYALSITNKLLVRSYPHAKKEVIVNAAVYKKWISEGGKNEVLFGAIIQGEQPQSAVIIAEKAESYYASWTRYEALYAATRVTERFNLARASLRYGFQQELLTFSEEEQEYINENPNFKETALATFEELLQNVSVKELEDLYEVSLKLLCRARFAYTDAEKILVGINEAKRQNKNLDIRDAALIATIEYVVDYICDQMEVTGPQRNVAPAFTTASTLKF